MTPTRTDVLELRRANRRGLNKKITETDEQAANAIISKGGDALSEMLKNTKELNK